MKSFGTNSNNDIFISDNGSLNIVEDIQAVLSVCKHVAQTVRGEMVLNLSGGIPYFGTVWSNRSMVRDWEGLLRERLTKVDGVKSVVSLTTSVDGDVLNYRATIKTIYGEGDLNGNV